MLQLLPQGMAFARVLQDLNLGLPVALTQQHNVLALLYPLERANDVSGTQLVSLLQQGIVSGVRFAARGTAQDDFLYTQPATEHDIQQSPLWQNDLLAQTPTQREQNPSPLLIHARDILRRAELLPAGFLLQVHDAARINWLPSLSVCDIDVLVQGDPRDHLTSVTLLAQANLPIEGSEHNTLYAFRNNADGIDHYALFIGSNKPIADDILVRMHSECFTGDFLGSLKCDCGPQLKAAIARMCEVGQGVLLYLRQEGRGIGLSNKIRAYALQDKGMDTVDANLHLGFSAEQRHFKVATQMLQTIGVQSITLLTNNPRKIQSADQYGIKVVARASLVAGVNRYNEEYLKTKRDKTGHQFDER